MHNTVEFTVVAHSQFSLSLCDQSVSCSASFLPLSLHISFSLSHSRNFMSPSTPLLLLLPCKFLFGPTLFAIYVTRIKCGANISRKLKIRDVRVFVCHTPTITQFFFPLRRYSVTNSKKKKKRKTKSIFIKLKREREICQLFRVRNRAS